MYSVFQWKHHALVLLASLVLVSVQCSRKAEITPDALYNSIERHFISGELAQADAESRRAAQLGDNGPVWAAKFRLQQAKVWVYQGRSQEAIVLLQAPLPDISSNPALGIARGAFLSLAYRRNGDPAGEAKSLSEAEGLCPDEVSCAEVRLVQGVIDIDNDRLADAKQHFETTLASARVRGDDFLRMQALLNLGVVDLRLEQYDNALDRSAEASTLANAVGNRLALEKATGNAGWAFYKMGNYRRALANSQMAAQQAATLGAPIDQARFLNDAGMSQSRLGDFAAARSSFEHSLQLARAIQNREETSDALVALASLSLQMGSLADANNLAREAEAIAEQRGNESDTLRPALIEALVLQRQGNASVAREKLLSLQQRSSAKLSVRWETESALARLAAAAGDNVSAVMWFRRSIETFHNQRSSIAKIESRLPFVENGSDLYLSYMNYLIHKGRVEEALKVLDQGRAETLAEGLNTSPMLRGDAAWAAPFLPSQRARHLNSTILVYCLQPETSYLWVIDARRIYFFRLPGRELLLPLIDSYNRAVRSSRDVLAEQDAAALSLYRYLVEPASRIIPPDGTVFIIGDQGLYDLNFETLLTSSERPHFWIEDVNIVNASSLSLLPEGPPPAQAGASHASRKRLLLIGEPTNNHPEYEGLLHAREEVASVAEHFSPDRRVVLTGSQATPAAYELSRPADYTYIHFVTHAVANEVDPLDSAIILSASADATQTYKLHAREILNQRLHADLVTVSACYGSGIQSYSGEGLIGLAWAFLRAGSHNVVGALWEVSDVSTPRLMSDLYDGLVGSSRPGAALRAAKLNMLHQGGVFRKPFYWAPFQLYTGT